MLSKMRCLISEIILERRFKSYRIDSFNIKNKHLASIMNFKMSFITMYDAQCVPGSESKSKCFCADPCANSDFFLLLNNNHKFYEFHKNLVKILKQKTQKISS